MIPYESCAKALTYREKIYEIYEISAQSLTCLKCSDIPLRKESLEKSLVDHVPCHLQDVDSLG